MIVTVGSAVEAARQATSAIPIVFPISVDPVGIGFVASLARPGGNITGLSIQTTDLTGKRLEILRELLPDLRRFAMIANVGYRGATLQIEEAQAAARSLGLEVDVLGIRRTADVMPAFDALQAGVQALYVCPDPLVNANHARINTLALGARLPTMHPFRDYLGAAASCPMAQTIPTCSGAPVTTSTKSCAARSRVTCRSNSRPGSSSLSTWSPPRPRPQVTAQPARPRRRDDRMKRREVHRTSRRHGGAGRSRHARSRASGCGASACLQECPMLILSSSPPRGVPADVAAIGVERTPQFEDRLSRGGADNTDRLRQSAAELVGLAPDVIVATAGAIVGALHQVSRAVPIVFVTTIDPVGSGFVDSLAHPVPERGGFLLFNG